MASVNNLSSSKNDDENSVNGARTSEEHRKKQLMLLNEGRYMVPNTNQVEPDAINELVKMMKKRKLSDGNLSKKQSVDMMDEKSIIMMDYVKPLRPRKAGSFMMKEKKADAKLVPSSPSNSLQRRQQSQHSLIVNNLKTGEALESGPRRSSTEGIREILPGLQHLEPKVVKIDDQKTITGQPEKKQTNLNYNYALATTPPKSSSPMSLIDPNDRRRTSNTKQKCEKAIEEDVDVANNENNGNMFLGNGQPFWSTPMEPPDEELEGVDDVFRVNAETIMEVQEGKLKLLEMPKAPIYLDQWAQRKNLIKRDKAIFSPEVVYSNTVRSLIMVSSDIPKRKDTRVFEHKQSEATQCDADDGVTFEPLPMSFYIYTRGDKESAKAKNKIFIKDYKVHAPGKM